MIGGKGGESVWNINGKDCQRGEGGGVENTQFFSDVFFEWSS